MLGASFLDMWPLKYYPNLNTPAMPPGAARRHGRGLLKGFTTMRHDSGSILVFSIWVLVFFSILSVGLYRITLSQIQLANRLEGKLTGYYLAKAAVVYTQEKMKEDKTGYNSLFMLRPKEKVELGSGEFERTIIDEESKLNINTASAESIARLPGLTPELAEKIVNSGLRPFHLKEELLLIEGVEEQIFEGLKDYISVYSEGAVNINTASEVTLKALGLEDSVVKAIVGFRAGPDNKEATKDDGVFENTGEIVTKLQSYAAISGPQITSLLNLINGGVISVASKIFSLGVQTRIRNRLAGEFLIVIDSEKVRQWTEW